MSYDWAKILAPDKHWRTAYPAVAQAVREYLSTFGEGETISTTELVEVMHNRETYPDDKRVRNRLYKALTVLASLTLSDCVTLGEPSTVWGRQARLKLWHKPDASKAVSTLTPGGLCHRLAALNDGSIPGPDLDQLILDAKTLSKSGV